MSDDPFLMLSRGYFDHALWAEERVYSRAEAWLDLVRMAAWNGHKRLIGVTMVDIPRGGIVAAERFLSDRWMWSRTKVRAFIDLLESERMVTRKKDQGISVISLCNYERFNTPKNQEKTKKEPRQDHDKTKVEEDIEEEDVERRRAPKKEAEGDHAEFIRRWSEEFPKHHHGEAYLFQGAKDGAAVSRLLKACGKTPEELERVFVAAWKHSDLFNCKNAASIARFVGSYNEIRAELNALKPTAPPADYIKTEWPEWLKSQGQLFVEYQFAPSFLKDDFQKARKANKAA